MGSLPATNPVKLNGKIEQFTLKIKGKPFYCHCKCNVFHKPDDKDHDLFKCNACGETYETG